MLSRLMRILCGLAYSGCCVLLMTAGSEAVGQDRPFFGESSGAAAPGVSGIDPADFSGSRPGQDPGIGALPGSSADEDFPELPPLGTGSGTGRPQGDFGSGILPERPGDSPGIRYGTAADGVSTDFNWKDVRLSVLDLRPALADVFDHGAAELNSSELRAYAELLDLIDECHDRTAASDELNYSVWQEAFYRFENARRSAWNNGRLSIGIAEASGVTTPADPFRKRDDDSTGIAEGQRIARYTLLADIRANPQEFVGRPVVLYGRFRQTGLFTLNRTDADAIVPGSDRIRLARGELEALAGGGRLATLDVAGFERNLGSLDSVSGGAAGESIPVLAKGWVVKLFGRRPLIYCESLRVLEDEPNHRLIIEHTHPLQRIQADENWLYCETLTQLSVTPVRRQRIQAAENLRQRLDQLIQEALRKARQDALALASRKKSETDPAKQNELQASIERIERLAARRVAKYRGYLDDPSDFESYVDLFRNPEAWQGKLITLRGYVRHAVSYDADPVLMPGAGLHELWLFTADSQSNPAVVVTPSLPPDFPLSADMVADVTVTGCFFKPYVYGAQDTSRVTPLILSADVSWNPDAEHVNDLVTAGHISPGTPTARRAAAVTRQPVSRTALLFLSFITLVSCIIVWGRWRREDRYRHRLIERVSHTENFELPVEADSDEITVRIRSGFGGS